MAKNIFNIFDRFEIRRKTKPKYDGMFVDEQSQLIRIKTLNIVRYNYFR